MDIIVERVTGIEAFLGKPVGPSGEFNGPGPRNARIKWSAKMPNVP
jgi:hypothetical protein